MQTQVDGRVAVVYLRATLSGLAAVFIALLGRGLVFALWNINQNVAYGLGAIAGGVLESIFSPLFWIFALSFFALFFTASRLDSKMLRVILFWTPTVAISTLGVGLCSLLFAYARLHFKG
jgi:hypothetical protein